MKEAKANFFFPIVDTWPQYFKNPDEGLGTVYERILLHRFFERLKNRFHIESVLEAPSFGMTGVSGVNSLWWAKNGVSTVVVDDDRDRIELSQKIWRQLGFNADFVFSDGFVPLPFKDKTFDLSWNFASLWFVPQLKPFLDELNRITKKVIFISVPNYFGVGYQLRLHWPGNRKPALAFEHIKAKNFVPQLQTLGWTLTEHGYFDIPPWPDFPLKKEVLFDRLKLGFLLKLLKKKGEESKQGMSILDYFSGLRPELDKEVLKFGFLEKAPWPIRPLWAHHQYYIFVKE